MSEQEIQQILAIIEQSFLRSDEKDALKNLLGEKGASVSFFEEANRVFSQALLRNGELSDEIVQKFDDESAALEQQHQQNISELGESLEKNIDGVDATDLVMKNEIFDRYYLEKERLDEQYIERLKKMTSQLAMRIIKDVF